MKKLRQDVKKSHGFKCILKRYYNDLGEDVYFLKESARNFLSAMSHNDKSFLNNYKMWYYRSIRFFAKLGR